MSEEDVEIVRRSFDAWSSGDEDAIRDLYTEDVVIETPGGLTNLRETVEGDDPVGRWLAENREAWSETRWEVERIFEKGEAVVSFYRAVTVGRGSGVEVVRDLTAVHRIRDGKIAIERVYIDR